MTGGKIFKRYGNSCILSSQSVTKINFQWLNNHMRVYTRMFQPIHNHVIGGVVTGRNNHILAVQVLVRNCIIFCQRMFFVYN